MNAVSLLSNLIHESQRKVRSTRDSCCPKLASPADFSLLLDSLVRHLAPSERLRRLRMYTSCASSLETNPAGNASFFETKDFPSTLRKPLTELLPSQVLSRPDVLADLNEDAQLSGS